MSAQAGGAVKATLTMVGDRELRVERVFDASRERVWRAYTEPALLAQWWGRGNELVVERFEFTVGGHWRFVERVEGEEYGFEGRFREIQPPALLSHTFEWDGMPGHVIVETTRFEALEDGRTRIVGRSMFMTAEDRAGMESAGMEQGMNESYAALDRVLAAMG